MWQVSYSIFFFFLLFIFHFIIKYIYVCVFLIFPKNKVWHFMQMVPSGDNSHEMQYLYTKKNILILSAENFT